MSKRRLYNLINSDELRARIAEDPAIRVTLSFYQYFPIPEPYAYRDRMFAAFDDLGVLGRIYVSYEGVNGQISVPHEYLELLRTQMSEFGMPGIRLNIAIEDDGKSFFKLAIKVREKIVADGLEEGEIDLRDGGEHLSAAKFNEITDRPETVLVDMRNYYESEVGHFEGAILPEVITFRESLPKVVALLEEHKDKPVVMYCTGGIRCEKASAYFKSKGFQEIYQLDGGIIEYARQVEAQGLPNKFKGKNFVFDERLGERIGEEVIAHCHQCGSSADTHVNCANDACHLLFIQCPACAEKYNGCCSQKCADFIALPMEEQRQLRKTETFNGTKFGKGRYQAFGDQLIL